MTTAAELERLARRDDAAAVAAAVLGLGEEERRALAPGLLHAFRALARRADETFERSDWDALGALYPALLPTATSSELRKLGRPILALDHPEQSYAVLADRRPPWLAEWADWAIGEQPGLFELVRRLHRDGIELDFSRRLDPDVPVETGAELVLLWSAGHRPSGHTRCSTSRRSAASTRCSSRSTSSPPTPGRPSPTLRRASCSRR